MAQLPGWLLEDLATLPPAVAAAGAPTAEACCKAALERMEVGGEAFARALVDALVRDGEAAGNLQPVLEPEARPGPPRELRLVDLDVAEEDAMLAAIARRLAGSASLSLLLLGQRFAVLLARPPLDPAALPLGPRAFCDALAEATARLEACAHARLALYRRFDLDGMALYARFAEAVDHALDDAGILRGMSFVPLQRQSHVALTVAQATERDALQAVGRAAEALQPESGLAPGALRGRRDAMAALARYLMRHGRDSNQWSECIEVAESLQDAALAHAPPPVEAQAWLDKAFRELGYPEEEAGQLAAGLAPDGGIGDAQVDDAPVLERGVREQRCFDRLRQLPAGAMLGFSAGRGGFLHARLDAHHAEPPRLLLNCMESGCEIIFETDMLARMLASGEAWVVRRAIAGEGPAP